MDRSWKFQLLRYAIIGGISFCVDAGLFQALVWVLSPSLGLKIALACAVVFANAVAMTVHFSLNKYVNFRAHDRAIHLQAGTYVVVAAVNVLLALSIVEILVVRAGLIPIVAKVLSVIMLMPFTFSAHRFLTFGPGIAARIRRVLGAAPNR